MVHCQDNWEGRYGNGRVASLDYTQLRERAASEAVRQWQNVQENTNCNLMGSLLL
jgi:hypothetical protein